MLLHLFKQVNLYISVQWQFNCDHQRSPALLMSSGISFLNLVTSHEMMNSYSRWFNRLKTKKFRMCAMTSDGDLFFGTQQFSISQKTPTGFCWMPAIMVDGEYLLWMLWVCCKYCNVNNRDMLSCVERVRIKTDKSMNWLQTTSYKNDTKVTTAVSI